MEYFGKLIKKLIILLLFLVTIFSYPYASYSLDSKAIFAGGCFWCLEHDLERLPGVVSVISGYSGGDLMNPTYENHNGHQEVVLVKFDSSQISYQELLRSYWRNVDPLDDQGQFCDRGRSYKPVIFTQNDEQKVEAVESKHDASVELDKPLGLIRVEIKDAKQFWPAEDYHQNFAELNKRKYQFYRYTCGRDARLDQVWGDTARTGKEWQKLSQSLGKD